ncbi:MAG: GntG family PLP-dependent aldolase [Candidatus Thermoplasmatota archaeon]|nr:GntG family PLP-dependent aldolase [Candidatus Thermoplasmatota archaeon]
MRDYPSDRVDLRSDTVTQPTPAMREAMASARVGDDVLGDDPTVIELQERLAQMLGKESALFVSSGTMSNATAIRAQTEPGDEIITEAHSHIYIYEGGGFAALSGVSVALVPGVRGIMDPGDVAKAVRKGDGSLGHFPNGSMVCVENTSNRGGGTCYSLDAMDAIARVARENDCTSHIDGARIFNASVATGQDVSRIARDYDSISICLSKGLGAPVGSVLVGSSEMISRAYRWRKMFGGGMRQAGIIAAAGNYALDNNIDRLSEDHIRARRLAEAIEQMPAFSVDLEQVQTNMVYIGCEDGGAERLVSRLSEQGVDALSIDESSIRAVTHLHITDDDIDKAINAFEKAQ